MKRPLAGLRLGVLLLFILGLLSPVAASSVGAQDFTCDDFNSQAAAQAVLDADPSLEESLDPDGDGIACNEDEETPAEDDNGGSGDADAEQYLADIQDEVDGLQASVERFLEIDQIGADATQEEVDELNEIAADWVDYPDVAAEFTAPEGLEDVEDAYNDLADTVGAAGELWEEYWNIPSGDPEEDAALEAFNEEFISAQDQIDVVNELIADAGGSTAPTDDPTEEPTDEPSGDADAYLAEVQDNAGAWAESADRAIELFDAAAEGLSDAEVDEFTEIMDTWVAAPDTAAELEAPEGLEDVQDAYGALADEYAAAAVAFDEWASAEAGSTEEEDAAALFTDTIDSALDLTDDLTATIEDAGGSTEPTDDPTEEPTDDPTEEPTDDPTEEPTDEPSGDAAAYLADVRDTADEWNAGVARFTEIIALGGDATDAEFDEAAEIVTSWLAAPETAAELVAPEGLEDVQAAYEDYADELASAATFFTEWLGTDAGTPEEEEAFNGFIDAITQSQALYADLDSLLADVE